MNIIINRQGLLNVVKSLHIHLVIKRFIMIVEITKNFDYVSEETGLDIDYFDDAKFALIVYDDCGCLCDDDSAVDFDTNGDLSSDISYIIEGVYSYSGELSSNDLRLKLESMGYDVD
jgi:hypothetical protein